MLRGFIITPSAARRLFQFSSLEPLADVLKGVAGGPCSLAADCMFTGQAHPPSPSLSKALSAERPGIRPSLQCQYTRSSTTTSSEAISISARWPADTDIARFFVGDLIRRLQDAQVADWQIGWRVPLNPAANSRNCKTLIGQRVAQSGCLAIDKPRLMAPKPCFQQANILFPYLCSILRNTSGLKRRWLKPAVPEGRRLPCCYGARRLLLTLQLQVSCAD